MFKFRMNTMGKFFPLITLKKNRYQTNNKIEKGKLLRYVK